MKNRYVISTQTYYGQCPTCTSGSDGYELRGFASIEEIMDFALSLYPDESISLIFDTIEENNYCFSYETGRHCFTGIVVKENDRPIFRTIDNSRGILIWDDI